MDRRLQLQNYSFVLLEQISYICSVGRHNPDRFMGEN